MKGMDTNTCSGFVSATCIDGSCPGIPSEFDDREYGTDLDCEDCWFNTGKCEDCIFRGSEDCLEKRTEAKNDG